MTSSIVHDDASESCHAQQALDSTTEDMRFFPRWIGCHRASAATVSSSSSFQCHSPKNSVSEWGVGAFEQEVSICFLSPPDLTLDLDTPLRNQASSATLQPSGTGTATPIPRKPSDRGRRSSFLNFNLGNLFRPPASPPSTGFGSHTHLPPSQTQDQNDLVSLPSVSSASVSTFASASAFTVASNPSISTYASASASVAPSSVSKLPGRSRGARSHISSSSWSYSYPYSDYMSSSSGLSIQENYLEDIAADMDNAELEEPTSPTTTTASTTSASVSSSPRRSNLVRRFRLRGGADEQFLKPKSTNAGISSKGISSPVSPSKSSLKAKFQIDSKQPTDKGDSENSDHPRPNSNARLKKRLVFVEMDEEGRMIDHRRGGKVSGYQLHDTLKPKDGPAHETIGKSNSNSPLAVYAEHLSSTLSNNPFLHLRFRKQKRLLVRDIPTDDGEYTRSRIVALRQWAESLGAVRRLLRSIPDGTIWIEFKDREVAENVCHLHAHVQIPNVGPVRLDWAEGREAG